MSQEQLKEEQAFQKKKDFILKCVQLSKYFYKVSDSPMDQLKGLFISTLPNLINDEGFQNVENALKNRFDIMKDDINVSEQVKTLTKQHVLCISKLRQFNKENIELLTYSRSLFQELVD